MSFIVYAIRSETLAYYTRYSDDRIKSLMRGSHQISESAHSVYYTRSRQLLVYNGANMITDAYRL